jgi:hypothetical protein
MQSLSKIFIHFENVWLSIIFENDISHVSKTLMVGMGWCFAFVCFGREREELSFTFIFIYSCIYFLASEQPKQFPYTYCWHLKKRSIPLKKKSVHLEYLYGLTWFNLIYNSFIKNSYLIIFNNFKVHSYAEWIIINIQCTTLSFQLVVICV